MIRLCASYAGFGANEPCYGMRPTALNQWVVCLGCLRDRTTTWAISWAVCLSCLLHHCHGGSSPTFRLGPSRGLSPGPYIPPRTSNPSTPQVT